MPRVPRPPPRLEQPDLDEYRTRRGLEGDVRAKTQPLPGSFQDRVRMRPLTCRHCGARFMGIHSEIGCLACIGKGLPQFAGSIWDD